MLGKGVDASIQRAMSPFQTTVIDFKQVFFWQDYFLTNFLLVKYGPGAKTGQNKKKVKLNKN